MFDLSGKVAVVTGGGQGVGRGIVQALAAQGATVAVNDRDPERAESVAAAVGGLAAPFDVSDRPAVEAGLGLVVDALGPVDILVNNAGKGGQHGIGMSPFRHSGPEQWNGPLAVDYLGAVHCTRAVINPMCDGGWGRIVSIVSDAGTTGVGVAKGIGVSAYGAAKGAVISLMRHVAVESAAFGVTANSVALGLMERPDGQPSPLADTIPVGRMGAPADAGALCVYLASVEASWMTGQTIQLGGGQVTS